MEILCIKIHQTNAPRRVECMREAAEIRLGENLDDVDYHYGNHHNSLNMSPYFFWSTFVFNYAKQLCIHESPTKVSLFSEWVTRIVPRGLAQ
jgi:hypothetical protein